MPDLDVLADDFAAADSSGHGAQTGLLVRAQVSTDEAALTRLVGRGCSAPLPALDAVLSLHPADPAQADAGTWNDSLSLQGPFGCIEFAQGARLMRALTQIDLSAELNADEERWEWLQAALVGRLGGTPLACADRLLRHAPQDCADATVLRVCVRSGQHALVTHARGAAAAWADLLQRESWTPERSAAQAWLGLPLETPVPVARHTLPSHALRRLTVGDIVLPDSPRFDCSGEGSVRIGALLARVRYQAPGALEIIAVEGQLNTEDLQMMDAAAYASAPMEADGGGYFNAVDPGMPVEEAPPGGEYQASGAYDTQSFHAAPAALDDDAQQAYGQMQPQEQSPGVLDVQLPHQTADAQLDAVPVTLDFELGKVRMSLGEVRTLGSGVIVPLSGGSPASIAILSAGRRLGSGEVVDINGQLGIRITQWGAPC